jgi:DNA recombination protein RmuC
MAQAASEADARQAEAGFRRDVLYHVKSISESYLIPDETQDTALMFVPSESIFADIHEKFEDVVQKAMRARVLIVSPSMLLLAVQVIQGLLRDVRMKEEAHKIQKEVRDLLDDVRRLGERVGKLQTHFRQANEDLTGIVTSAEKISGRGERIALVELDDPASPAVVSREPERKIGGLF